MAWALVWDELFKRRLRFRRDLNCCIGSLFKSKGRKQGLGQNEKKKRFRYYRTKSWILFNFQSVKGAKRMTSWFGWELERNLSKMGARNLVVFLFSVGRCGIGLTVRIGWCEGAATAYIYVHKVGHVCLKPQWPSTSSHALSLPPVFLLKSWQV